MSGFDGLWKWQNNPASTKRVKSLQNQSVEVGPYAEKEEECTPFFP